MKGKTEMGFNNGYDAGWQDAINAVKYGKVPGLGQKAASGSDGSSIQLRSPSYFSLAGSQDRVDGITLSSVSGDDISGSGVFTQLAPTSVPCSIDASGVVVTSGPDGGWVPGDLVFLNSSADVTFEGVPCDAEDGVSVLMFKGGTTWDLVANFTIM